MSDFYADLIDRREDYHAQIKGSDVQTRSQLLKAISEIDRALAPGDSMDPLQNTGNPLADKWLQMLDEGREPDLTEGLPEDLRKKLKAEKNADD